MTIDLSFGFGMRCNKGSNSHPKWLMAPMMMNLRAYSLGYTKGLVVKVDFLFFWFMVMCFPLVFQNTF